MSESNDQKLIRLRLAERGLLMFRNNVGVLQNKDGAYVRYGLANDSTQMNKHTKSSDLIGIEPVIITLDMVGSTFGRFIARECKRQDWVYTGNEREAAQLNFINLVNRYGGNAGFITKGDV